MEPYYNLTLRPNQDLTNYCRHFEKLSKKINREKKRENRKKLQSIDDRFSFLKKNGFSKLTIPLKWPIEFLRSKSNSNHFPLTDVASHAFMISDDHQTKLTDYFIYESMAFLNNQNISKIYKIEDKFETLMDYYKEEIDDNIENQDPKIKETTLKTELDINFEKHFKELSTNHKILGPEYLLVLKNKKHHTNKQCRRVDFIGLQGECFLFKDYDSTEVWTMAENFGLEFDLYLCPDNLKDWPKMCQSASLIADEDQDQDENHNEDGSINGEESSFFNDKRTKMQMFNVILKIMVSLSDEISICGHKYLDNKKTKPNLGIASSELFRKLEFFLTSPDCKFSNNTEYRSLILEKEKAIAALKKQMEISIDTDRQNVNREKITELNKLISRRTNELNDEFYQNLLIDWQKYELVVTDNFGYELNLSRFLEENVFKNQSKNLIENSIRLPLFINPDEYAPSYKFNDGYDLFKYSTPLPQHTKTDLNEKTGNQYPKACSLAVKFSTKEFENQTIDGITYDSTLYFHAVDQMADFNEMRKEVNEYFEKEEKLYKMGNGTRWRKNQTNRLLFFPGMASLILENTNASVQNDKRPIINDWVANQKYSSQNTISKDHLNVNEPDTDEANFPKNYLASNIHIGAPCAARELGKWYRCKFIKICDNQNGWSKLDDIYCIVQSIDFGHYLKVSTTKLRFLPKRLALTWPPFAHPFKFFHSTQTKEDRADTCQYMIEKHHEKMGAEFKKENYDCTWPTMDMVLYEYNLIDKKWIIRVDGCRAEVFG